MLRLHLLGSASDLVARQHIRNRRARAKPARPIGSGQLMPDRGGRAALGEAPAVATRSLSNSVDIGPVASGTLLYGPNCLRKRVFDVVVAAMALLFLLPMLIATAVAVIVDTPGPVLFLQWRGGKDGRRFRILKFRTMTCMEDGAEVQQARSGDPRITRVGRVLRRTSIDEVPQLLNVLRGDMSLVGPRPHALVHDRIYSNLIARYTDRQSVRPGMTGWAQVNGCRGETRDLMTMERRVQCDLEYLRRWSLRLDLVILGMTIVQLLRPEGEQ